MTRLPARRERRRPDAQVHHEQGWAGEVHHDGATYLPASKLNLISIGRGAEDADIEGALMLMNGGDGGLHAAMTPETMRIIAGNLLRVADILDRNAAASAAALIARAKDRPR